LLTHSSLKQYLVDLNKIATENGGNRAFGHPGFKASRDYILSHTQQFTEQIDTVVQSFNYSFWIGRKISVKGPSGEDVFTLSPTNNPATPLPGGITGELVDTPVDDARGE